VNIKTRFEFFSGFGFAELVPTVIAALLSGVVAFVVHGVTADTVAPILIVLVTIAASVMCLAKGAYSLSMLDQICQLIRFSNGQKTYKYRRLNEWGDV
jgi:hypothetical protein